MPTIEWATAKYLPLPLEEKWIEVDLSDQKLWAWDGTELVFETTISSGKAHTPTVQGKFRILRKYDAQLMTGPGYYLPNVPWVMYFYAGYALHGAYWHDKWGTPTSHGCVNLRREDAKWLYDWTGPVVPEGTHSVASSKSNPGTWVLVHQ
jgi:lipoprotein-anchoring transpeptidase ErfK/SrfK